MQIFFDENNKICDELRILFKMEPVPVRPNRKNERYRKRNRRKFHMNKKRAV